MRVVICGASGFVGRHLAPRLAAAGHDVVCGSRDPARAAAANPAYEWTAVDVEQEESLLAAFRGADAVVYLVHQMRSDCDDLVEAERRSAHRVRLCAERCGVSRLVYLGGPEPAEIEASSHLRARLVTGEVLRGGTLSTIELRAPMVVGAGSESWWIVRDLALRLPVMVLPKWLASRSEPIAIDDVVAALVRAVELVHPGSGCFDLPGPEVLSARQILVRVAAAVGIRPLLIPVPVLTPSLSSHWIRWVTRADYAIARKLVDGLTSDLVSSGPSFWDVAPDLERTPFDKAVRLALDAESEVAGPGQRLLEGVVRRVALRAS